MKKRYLFLLALLAFGVTFVLHAPAARLYAAVQPKPAGTTKLHGVHGTLVTGGFAALTVNNRPVLRDVKWSLQPAWLALLRLSADLEAGGDTVVRARVSRAPFGAFRIADLNAAGSVKAVLGALGQPALPVEGQMRIEMPLLRFKGGVPITAEGSADLENLAWTLAKEPLLLGSFNASLSTDDKGILASIGSGPGPLEVSGSATLDPRRAYDVHLQVRPRPEATPQLQSLVRSLGQPDAQGWYHIRRNGTL